MINNGYRQAIDDILKHLKEMRGEENG